MRRSIFHSSHHEGMTDERTVFGNKIKKILQANYWSKRLHAHEEKIGAFVLLVKMIQTDFTSENQKSNGFSFFFLFSFFSFLKNEKEQQKKKSEENWKEELKERWEEEGGGGN